MLGMRAKSEVTKKGKERKIKNHARVIFHTYADMPLMGWSFLNIWHTGSHRQRTKIFCQSVQGFWSSDLPKSWYLNRIRSSLLQQWCSVRMTAAARIIRGGMLMFNVTWLSPGPTDAQLLSQSPLCVSCASCVFCASCASYVSYVSSSFLSFSSSALQHFRLLIPSMPCPNNFKHCKNCNNVTQHSTVTINTTHQFS